jgi:hypothetical protein
MQQSVSLIKPHHKVHVLNSLARGTLYEVIDCRNDNQPVVAIIEFEPNVTVVCAAYM